MGDRTVRKRHPVTVRSSRAALPPPAGLATVAVAASYPNQMAWQGTGDISHLRAGSIARLAGAEDGRLHAAAAAQMLKAGNPAPARRKAKNRLGTEHLDHPSPVAFRGLGSIRAAACPLTISKRPPPSIIDGYDRRPAAAALVIAGANGCGG